MQFLTGDGGRTLNIRDSVDLHPGTRTCTFTCSHRLLGWILVSIVVRMAPAKHERRVG
jgi:hypothetical protein